MCRVHTTRLQTNIFPSMKIYVRDYISTYCMAYICDMPIIPCIHTPINTCPVTGVRNTYYIEDLDSWSTGLQVYSQMSTDAVYRSVYL